MLLNIDLNVQPVAPAALDTMTADPQEDDSKVGVKLHVSVLGSSSHSDVLHAYLTRG